MKKGSEIYIGLLLALVLALVYRLGFFGSPVSIANGPFRLLTEDNIIDELTTSSMTLFSSKFDLEKRNSELLEENRKLYAELFKMSYELNTLGEFRDQVLFNDFELVGTKVVNSLPFEQDTILIKGGIDQGFEVGMALVVDNFLVGRVTEVRRESSIVMMISNIESRVSGKVIGKKTKGIIVGTSSEGNELSMEEVFIRDRLAVGDIIVTTSIDSGLPVGLVLGQVDDIEEVQSNTTKSVVLRTFINFEDISDSIYVVTDY